MSPFGPSLGPVSPKLHLAGTLDFYVDQALDFFERAGSYRLDLPRANRNRQTLVVGSQSGYWTGVQLFASAKRCFASAKEVDAQDAINRGDGVIDSVALVSATGSRQMIEIAEYALERALPVDLIVCRPGSAVTKACGRDPNFREILVPGMEQAPEEPPTTNTCTYGRMLQGVSGEDPAEIRRVLRNLPQLDYGSFKAFVIAFPNRFGAISELVEWKMNGENLGRQLGCKAQTLTNLMHGGFVVDLPDELYLGLGLRDKESDVFHEILRDVPESRKVLVDLGNAGPLTTLMAGYALVGYIQKFYPAFQRAISDYARRSAAWNWLSPIANVAEGGVISGDVGATAKKF